AVDGAAEMARQELRAEADAEERLLLAQRHLEPVDLAPDELLLVVGAHRPAEDDGARMVRERLRQRVAEARPPDVERVAATPEDLRHPAWCRMFLMQDEQNGQWHESGHFRLRHQLLNRSPAIARLRPARLHQLPITTRGAEAGCVKRRTAQRRLSHRLLDMRRRFDEAVAFSRGRRGTIATMARRSPQGQAGTPTRFPRMRPS